MPGPARQPRHLKLLKGTLQKSRDLPDPLTLDVCGTLPPPPGWLKRNLHAVKEYKRLGPKMLALRLLNEGNYSAFVTMCALHGRNVALLQKGITPTAAHLSTYRAFCGSLGLLAMNLGQPKNPDSDNPYAKFRRLP